MEESQVLVSFEIHGFDVDPDEITRLLKLKPTSVERKGKTAPNSTQVAKVNSWTLASSLRDEQDVDAHLQDLIEKLGSFDELDKLKPIWSAQFNCIVHFVGDDHSPYLGLSPSTLKSVGDMGCGFEVEYFIHP